jgi:hypothetical protein
LLLIKPPELSGTAGTKNCIRKYPEYPRRRRITANAAWQ